MNKEEIEALGLEESIKKLEETALRLEQGSDTMSLEEMMALYQEGAMLSEHAAALLNASQKEIQMLEQRFKEAKND